MPRYLYTILTINHSRSTDQIIYVKDPPPLLRDKIMSDSAALENFSRLNSFRNTSFDLTSIISEGKSSAKVDWLELILNSIYISANSSNYLRRPSSHKQYSMSVEAPITKVINIILAAQENQPSYIAQALDKVARQTSSHVVDNFSYFIIKIDQTNLSSALLTTHNWYFQNNFQQN